MIRLTFTFIYLIKYSSEKKTFRERIKYRSMCLQAIRQHAKLGSNQYLAVTLIENRCEKYLSPTTQQILKETMQHFPEYKKKVNTSLYLYVYRE